MGGTPHLPSGKKPATRCKRLLVYLTLPLATGLFFLGSACARLETPVETPPTGESVMASLPAEPWLLVDTQAETLSVLRGDDLVAQFDNIAFGSSGAGLKHRRGDRVTPVGVFRVGWVNPNSRFTFFVGLDYPNLAYAEQALRENRIDKTTYERIRGALLTGRSPPQDTVLGGDIGIHGIGAGDPFIHDNFNWTNGCIALDNQQIQRLAPWVQKGTRVEIR